MGKGGAIGMGLSFPMSPQTAQKSPSRIASQWASGAPYWIRTSGLTLRRRALYPAELMAQKVFDFRGATGGIVTESIHSNAAGASLILEKYAFRLGAKLLICKSLYAGLF